MKAILFVLLITNTDAFVKEGKVDYTLVERSADMTWEDCSKVAYGINEYSDVVEGAQTALCFPYTEQDERIINERSR